MGKAAVKQACAKSVKKLHVKTKKTGNNDTTTITDEAEWYIAENNITSLRRMVKGFSGRRDLSCLDLFGASGAIKNAWSRNKKKAELSLGKVLPSSVFVQLCNLLVRGFGTDSPLPHSARCPSLPPHPYRRAF